MDHLILIRHGEFTEGETKLNTKGREQMKELAAYVQEFNPKIFSSLGPRSIESANILAEELGTINTPLQIFGTNAKEDQSVNFAEALSLLKNLDENAVVVTKGEYITPFVDYFMKECLGEEVLINPVARGAGIHIDCMTKELTYFP